MRATSSPRRPSTSSRRTRPRRSTRAWSRWAWTFCSTRTPRSSPARPGGRPAVRDARGDRRHPSGRGRGSRHRAGRRAAAAGAERRRRRGAGGRVGAPSQPPSGRAGDGGRVRILITGGAGFLGSHLAEAWLDRGDEVTVLAPAADLKVRHLRANPRFRMIRESVLHRDILEGLVAWCDLVYHLAAVVGVEHYVGDPYQVLTVNINGTQEALTAAFRHQKKVVFSSTSEIYGRNPAVPSDENRDRVP